MPMIFAACILRRNHGTFEARKIKQRIAQRLALWKEGQVEALVTQIEDAVITAAGGAGTGTDEARDARAFNSAVLDGKVRSAVRRLTVRDGGGVLSPEDKCTKTGERVIDMLAGKHPDLRYPDLGSEDNIAFEHYDSCPDPVPLVCNPVGMEEVAKKLGGQRAWTASMLPMQGRT